ncbi:MAG: hypothetical protein KDC10_14505 [Calditrichaeota bacterium]|nr:hypothetical protein [Calditrichota bacterium]
MRKSLQIHIGKRMYPDKDVKPVFRMWRVGIPVSDATGQVVRRERLTFPPHLTARQVEQKARESQEALCGDAARPVTKARLLQTLLDYFDTVTCGPQPKAAATTALDWRVIRFTALWLLDRGSDRQTDLSHLGRSAEQAIRVQQLASRIDLTLDQFRRNAAEQLRDYFAKRFNATSTNLYLRHLAAMLNWAVGQERIAKNPLSQLDRLDVNKPTAGMRTPRELCTAYTASDVAAILLDAQTVSRSYGSSWESWCGLRCAPGH